MPNFPGVPPAKLAGKSFEMLALDVHYLKEGKIARSWHLEDWASALDQMLNGKPTPNLDMPDVTTGPALTRDQLAAIDNYYSIVSDLSK